MNFASSTGVSHFADKIPFHAPVDWIVIAILAFIVILDVFRSGSTKAAAWSISLPLCAMLFELIPRTAFLGKLTAPLSSALPQFAIFCALFIVLFFVIYRIAHALGESGTGILQAIISAFAVSIVTAVIWVREPAIHALAPANQYTQVIFGEPYALFLILTALIALAFVRS
jgi:bacteriorhodopsin